jgi:hypothetical protein
LLLHHEAIVSGAKRVEPEYACATAIMVRIDQDFEMIIEVLIDIAPEFRCDDPEGAEHGSEGYGLLVNKTTSCQ